MPQEAVCKRNDLAFPMRSEVVHFDVHRPLGKYPADVTRVNSFSFANFTIKLAELFFFFGNIFF
jgi:hypothetical protein